MNQLTKLLRRMKLKTYVDRQKKEVVDVSYFLNVKGLPKGTFQSKTPSY